MYNPRLSAAVHFAALAVLATSMTTVSAQIQPDNTGMNKGDQSKSAMTADKQKMNASDRALTQKIRKAVISDKSLSTYAHNVKIVSRDGMVTLKGPVRSDNEKHAIVARAAEAAGADKVTDQMSVAPPSK